MSTVARIRKGATSKDSTQRQLFPEDPEKYLENVLDERNQLKEEVAQKNKEIDKLRAIIQFVLQHLSKAQVDCSKEIRTVSIIPEQQQAPPTPHPVVEIARNNNISRDENQTPNSASNHKELGKRHRKEEADCNNRAQEKKRKKSGDVSSTIDDLLDKS